MADPLISVIVPIYNAENTLSRCLDSIISQDYPNMEVLLVNDGSTDNSHAICVNYAKRDFRFSVINTANNGASSARNEGLRNAKGEYVGFVDADDWIDSDMYTVLYKGIVCKKENCMSVIGVHARRWDEYLYSLCGQESQCTISTEKCIEEVTKEYGLRGYLWNKLFRNIGLFLDETLVVGEDLEYVIRYLLSFPETLVTVVNKCSYYYNVIEIHDFSKLRYGFEKMYGKLISLHTSINLLQNKHKKAVLHLEAEICMTCYGLLLYWYSLKGRDKDEYLLILKENIQKDFNTYFSHGLKQVNFVRKIKIILLRISPHILVALLRFKKKINLEGQ